MKNYKLQIINGSGALQANLLKRLRRENCLAQIPFIIYHLLKNNTLTAEGEKEVNYENESF